MPYQDANESIRPSAAHNHGSFTTQEPAGDFENPFRLNEARPVGIWISLAANIVGLCAGAVFLLASPGDRFRGMEPEAAGFTVLCTLGILVGLAGGTASLYDLLRRGLRLWGAMGTLLAFTPLPVALLVSDAVREFKGLIFD